MKTLFKCTTFLFVFGFLISPSIAQSRSPAVEPVSGLSIDQGPDYTEFNGFQFKSGVPSSAEQTSTPIGYSLLFILALVSLPFLGQVLIRGNVIESTLSIAAPEAEKPISLEDYRNKKSEGPEESEEIKKAS